jgi:cytochrome c biogenesis protein ResB
MNSMKLPHLNHREDKPVGPALGADGRFLRIKLERGAVMKKLRRNLLGVRRFLRSPPVIVGELLALVLFCSLGAGLPQVGTATQTELLRLHAAGPFVAALVRLFALDHVFRSGWFLAATVLVCVSLVVIVLEQIRRLRIQWSQSLSEAHFRIAPFNSEFEREAVAGTIAPEFTAAGSKLQIWTERRIGLLGSPVFHVGLLLIIVAGAARALFGTEAVVDLVEGETLPPTSAAWAGQWPGLLGRAFQLDCPLTLETVKPVHYQDGDLRELKVRLSLQHYQVSQPAELAVNHDLRSGGGRIFLGSDFGPAALVEWQRAGAAPKREAALLAGKSGGSFEGTSTGPNHLRAYLRARVDAEGAHPQSVEVRVMRDGALLFTGDARPGQTVSLRSGEKLVLHGTPFWVRLRGSHDPALWLAYFGFALVMAGAVLIFAVVKVDACVLVTPLGERERIFVALRPQRFAPLFQERFDQLVRECAAGLLPAAPRAKPAGESPETRWCGTPTSQSATVLLLLLCLGCVTGCGRSAMDQARQLVEHYDQVVSEAYRRGDVKLIDPVVGPNEGKKLTGLIGVRLDLGLTLDSQLLSLEVNRVEKSKDELRVTTKERWRYRDRKIGTGEQVGEESLDSYEMLYVFKKTGQAWLVDEIRFVSPPQVGRKQMSWLADHESAPGITGNAKAQEIKQP